MATPLSADRLVAALRDEGVTVVEYKSWRTHNRNHMGAWGPVHGVMIHHTVTSGTDASVELCYAGRSDLPGPLCHGVIAKNGTVYLVGNGRANHAGSGDPDVLRAVIAEAPLPPDNENTLDGNARFYGFECVNRGDGKDPWPPEQVEAIVRAAAAICRAHDWGRCGDTSVIGHLEWRTDKSDPKPSPGGDDVRMATLRQRVAERLTHPADWSPDQPKENGMPKRALYTTENNPRTIQPGTWTTLRFNRYHNGTKWVDKQANSVIHGPCSYSASLGVHVSGLKRGQEFQIRLAHYSEDGGEFKRAAAMPIHSPVQDAAAGRFVYSWNGHVSGANSGCVRAEVLHLGDEPVTVESARIEALYWPS